MRQLLLNLLPTPAPSLDNFIVGANGEALAALTAWLAAPGDTGFVLWGEAGSGRSHLLQAVGADYLDAAQDPALAALPADSLFIAVDNVEQLDADGQIALFHAFNRLRADGGRLLAAAAQAPSALALREDLRTRLGLGLIYRLRALSDDDKQQAMVARAAELGMPLGDDAIDFLFSHVERDMGTLVALVDTLDEISRERRKPVTLRLLRDIIASGSLID